MKRPALLAIVALIVVFGGGALFYTLFLGEEAQGRATAAEASPEQAIQTAVPDASVPDAVERGIRATKVVGSVEAKSGGGEWVRISEGDALNETDEVRVGALSSASFDIGQATTVDAPNDTRFRFLEISQAVSKIRLDDGQLASSTEGSKLRIEVKNSDAVAESQDGRFSVMTAGDGHVAVATETGSATLSAKGEDVEVEAGKQSFVRPNSAPTRPTEIPSSIFLKVNRPRADSELKTTVVRGTAPPGAIINIGGQKSAVGKDGKFKSRVALAAGSRSVTVVVRDAAGRSNEVSVKVIAPEADTKGSVEW